MDADELFKRRLKDLKDGDPNARRTTAWNLGKSKERRAVEPLIQTLKEDVDSDVRRNAAKALGWIGDNRAVESLIQALGDESRYVREAAAEFLGLIGDMRAVEPLIEILNDRNVFVRMSTAKALDSLEWKSKDETERARHLVAKREWNEVNKIGELAVKPLLNAILDEQIGFGIDAMKTLRAMGEKGIKCLIQALNDGDKDIRRKAALVIGSMYEKRGVEPLIRALKDEDSEVRINAAWALGVIREERAIEPLRQAREDAEKDEDWDLLIEVEEALDYILSKL